MIIYRALNLINGKSYIGQTTRSLEIRIIEHYRHAFNYNKNTYFHKALRKYGKENFRWEILSEATNKNELDKLEKKYITKYDSYDHGYNLTFGGDGALGFKHDEETKNKISKSTAKITNDQVIKIKELLRDVNWLFTQIAEEVGVSRDIVRDIYRGKTWKNVHVEGFNPLMFRDTCENMSLVNKEAVKKCHEKIRGKKRLTPYQIKAIKKNIEEKISYNKIAEKYGVSTKTIYRINEGKTHKNI